MIEDRIRRALSRGHRIDITTTGRHSGRPRRIEIVFHNFDGPIYISGLPRRERRSWLANLDADPQLTIHLKGPVKADLPARARIIDDPAEREAILGRIAQVWGRTDLDTMVRWSPLIEVEIEGLAA
ncbi:MAG TPA: nitroreductase/quinone reductase family protein [Candidatus Limnocylindrales bacterium]|nr:nitroreductase/quinone reductase family protein [Candidatus Limnocylindrales bacterium]